MENQPNPINSLLNLAKMLPLPAAVLDLRAFYRNALTLAQFGEVTGKKIRIATKSIRCVELIRRVQKLNSAYQGLMCYSVSEAFFLAEKGFDDLLIAYPTSQADDLDKLVKIEQMKKKVYLVCDSQYGLNHLNAAAKKNNVILNYILEVDLSLQLPGGIVLGVRRSPLRNASHIADLIIWAKENTSHIQCKGVMGYESQVAGLGDRNKFKKLMNPIFKLIRKISISVAKKRRAQIAKKLIDLNIPIDIFNGGGTGSIHYTKNENAVTELTVGSGFYAPHLFDYYSNLKLDPALYFALPIVRKPSSNWYTCFGGGYIASGEPGWDRVPIISWPADAKLSSFEACGEVQTPFHSKENLNINDPILFRHAKAGELCERFHDIHILDGELYSGVTPTYRGEGQCF